MNFAYAFSLWRNDLKEREDFKQWKTKRFLGIKLKSVNMQNSVQPCIPLPAALQCHPSVLVLVECDFCL